MIVFLCVCGLNRRVSIRGTVEVFNVFISVVHFELLSIQPMLQGLQSECSEQRWFVFLHSQRNQSSAGNT